MEKGKEITMKLIVPISIFFFFKILNRYHNSSYPHGSLAVMLLVLSCVCALVATMWGMASCRFMYIDYVTDRGSFSDFYRGSFLFCFSHNKCFPRM